ncbi:MFS transporter [Croceicoccus sp. BE223]|uniref:MFS transporter n=1 Tax=Croceicoccus sp. BE223 TaxID=2817716 RepID=UPI00285E2D09|nr:MFS transporter [Croceicoccus sp. BE223]MDR7103659.1 MFS family permease [Croceicoccus sp. BE223]
MVKTASTESDTEVEGESTTVGAPLRDPTFRRIWGASLLSNLGQQMQAVTAAWTMLQITQQADLVAMVQSASMLPVMLLAIAAGAIADMYDRRRVAIGALCISLAGSTLLAMAAALGVISPALILLGVFITGTGISLYSPAWQASAAEIVGVRQLPAAVALYSMSANAARSVGPAIGGFVIASAGMVFTFSVNAVLYIPIIVALFLWKRETPPPRLPPERLDHAMLAGLRFVRYSPPVMRVLLRSLAISLGGAAVYSMLPLVADAQLGGGPEVYGFLLGGFGLGAVSFALLTSRLRDLFSSETILMGCSLGLAAALATIALSPFLALSVLATFAAGGSWMISIATCNVSVQVSSPRWVSGRTLAAFQAAVAAGLALGSLFWGVLAAKHGVAVAVGAASALMASTTLLRFVLPMPRVSSAEAAPPPSSDPLIKMDLTGRSGPLVVEIEYRVHANDARKFYHAMRDVRRSRERNGAYGTSLARDISDPDLWVERFHYATWNDYLRARDRPTVDDRNWRDKALAFQVEGVPLRIRRYLERPTGSVRWREDTIDPGDVLRVPVSLTAVGSH